jgi:tRNA isopentenyl-2-thiomethyl-A-37 hydroxylase MiaE
MTAMSTSVASNLLRDVLKGCWVEWPSNTQAHERVGGLAGRQPGKMATTYQRLVASSSRAHLAMHLRLPANVAIHLAGMSRVRDLEQVLCL